jgi:hypothetical protein
MTLDAKDLEQLRSADPPPLPDAFEIMGTIAAESPEAVAEGRFSILLKGVAGPSGAPLLGRFCHADPALHRAVEEHLRAEEALRPDAIFAEVVHLPQGRIGNILSRPVLRRHEIPFLGRSGAAPEDQIPITDLLVSVVGSRIVLRSRRLGREVIPRLTSAHNYSRGSLGVYRFLCILQAQGLAAGMGWSWGALENAPFLPRVTAGKLVLSRARWRMSAADIEAVAKPKGAAERFAAVQHLRAERRLPRFVSLADADNELLIDLDNSLSIDSWLDVIEQRKDALLIEFFPGPDELCARGPEGRFVHELIVPLVRAPQETARPARPVQAIPEVARSFPPGSEWLYYKLYTGSSTADRVLRELVAPVVEEALGKESADGSASMATPSGSADRSSRRSPGPPPRGSPTAGSGSSNSTPTSGRSSATAARRASSSPNGSSSWIARRSSRSSRASRGMKGPTRAGGSPSWAPTSCSRISGSTRRGRSRSSPGSGSRSSGSSGAARTSGSSSTRSSAPSGGTWKCSST